MSSKPKVLVVDDESDLVDTLLFHLESFGCDTISAKDGAEALQILESQPITMVMSDIRMPRMNGVSLLEALNSKGIDVPVIFMTGYSDYTDEDIDQRGGVVLLHKPFGREQLKEIIEKFVTLLPEEPRKASGH